MKDLLNIIEKNWKKTVRNDLPRADFEDSGMIPLPYPYTSPSIDNYFSELFTGIHILLMSVF